MTYLLVPHAVGPGEATLWVGALAEDPRPARVILDSTAGQHLLDPTAWQTWASRNGQHQLAYQRVTVPGLAPRTTYTLELLVDGERPTAPPDSDFRRAEVTTLPAALPTLEAKPFTVLLGSCFCVRQDGAGAVGTTFFHLPPWERPEIKILCGDQVYLDDPAPHFLLHTHTPAALEAEFFLNYVQTWTHTGLGAGFRQLLMEGANYFCSDDHELWNNAPNRATLIRDTWPLFDRRQEWLQIARTLYQIFQTSALVTTFSVGTLAFCIAETRMHRDATRGEFMRPGELAAVGRWIDELTGPGVLVVGQPLFSLKTGFLQGHFGDWTLADFTQYGELVERLTASRHAIVILTGDVHFARFVSCTLPAGGELLEIISSPMALVDDRVEGRWEEAPPTFPAFDLPGSVKVREVHTRREFALTKAHFLTLAFAAAGAHVTLTVKAWPIARAGQPSQPTVVVDRKALR